MRESQDVFSQFLNSDGSLVVYEWYLYCIMLHNIYKTFYVLIFHNCIPNQTKILKKQVKRQGNGVPA